MVVTYCKYTEERKAERTVKIPDVSGGANVEPGRSGRHRRHRMYKNLGGLGGNGRVEPYGSG